jgi:hypothetical protein
MNSRTLTREPSFEAGITAGLPLSVVYSYLASHAPELPIPHHWPLLDGSFLPGNCTRKPGNGANAW